MKVLGGQRVACGPDVAQNWYQFHQHFTRTFFHTKDKCATFSSYVLALAKGFWQKSTFEKLSRKMLMKLTPGVE